MIAHSIDSVMQQPQSAYQAAQQAAYEPQPALSEARPLILVASNNAGNAMADSQPPQLVGAAPCYVHRGIGDGRNWNSVVASCEGQLVPVGAHAPQAAPQPLWLMDSSSRRVALKFLEAEAGSPSQSTLLAGLSLVLASLTLFFYARVFAGGRH